MHASANTSLVARNLREEGERVYSANEGEITGLDEPDKSGLY